MEKMKALPFDKAFMMAIKDMIFIIEVGEKEVFTYSFLNQAVFERTDLTEADIGKTFHEVHSADWADILIAQYTTALSTREMVVYGDSYVSSTGEPYYSESTLTPIIDEDGSCTYIIGVVEDKTAERLANLESQAAWNRIEESHSRYRSLYVNNSDAIVSLDLTGQIWTGNSTFESLTGFSPTEIAGMKFGLFINEQEAVALADHFKQALTGVVQNFRAQFRGKSGQLISVSIQFTPIEEESTIVGVYAVMRDMREIDQLISRYEESENRFRVIAENAHDVIVLLDAKGEAIYVSPSVEQIYGFTVEEYMAKPPFQNVSPEDMSLASSIYTEAIDKAENYVIELRIQHKTHGWLWSELQGTPIFNEQNEFVHMLTIARDITLQKEHETKLHHYAYHDSMTGLPNRRFFKQRLSEEITFQQEQEGSMAVIMLDIDHFKAINDQYGHEVGDLVIEEFGRRLSLPLEERDLAARLAGDEFVILLPSVKTSEQAEHMAKRLQFVMEEPWHIQNGPTHVTSSMGIAFIPLTGATVSSVLKSADLAMYQAKEAGRDTFRLQS